MGKKGKKVKNPKSGAVAKTRTPKQQAALEARLAREQLMNAEQAQAQRLAQIVNLRISGHSFASIGKAIGATADEVETMMLRDAGAYVRTQPALRGYARNFIAEKLTGLLEGVYEEATDRTHPLKLENSQQSLRILKEMSNLFGAAAPTQSEVTVDAAPEAVERLVAKFSAQQGVAYDMDVFDVEVEEVHEAHDQAVLALEQASDAVDAVVDEDEDL